MRNNTLYGDHHSLTIRIILFSAIAVLWCGGASRTTAQSRARRPDQRIAGALDEQQIKYDVNRDNDYEVAIKFESGRRQIVTIESEVIRAKGTSPFRTVRATAMFSSAALPAAVVNRVKRENEEAGVEAWVILKYRDGTALERLDVADADTDGETLVEVIMRVAEEADALENTLTGEDLF